nr:MAG TPA: hypothetical protein [Caudoviricetes sp.]
MKIQIHRHYTRKILSHKRIILLSLTVPLFSYHKSINYYVTPNTYICLYHLKQNYTNIFLVDE